jgi:nitrate reductase NapD
MNIAGVLVHSRPEKIQDVRAEFIQMPGVEVHDVSEEGKMVVTVEEVHGADIAATMTQFHYTDGVLSAAMVYHHHENDPSEQEAPV